MKENYFVVISAILITIFLVGRAGIFDAPTGAATSEAQASVSSALNLHQIMTDFYGGKTFMMPRGPCGDVLQGLYADIAYMPVDVKTGFETDGPERIATFNFIMDRLRRIGTIDMMYGSTLLNNEDANVMVSINLESSASHPKNVRSNFLALDVYGYMSPEGIYVNKGQFSTPALDCIFVSHNGGSTCDCDAHSIGGIEIAGITGAVRDQGKLAALVERVRAQARAR